MNRKKGSILSTVILLGLFVMLSVGVAKVCYDTHYIRSKQDAEELCKIWNDNSQVNAEVYKLKSGTGVFQYTKALPVHYVLEGDGYIAYAIINDGKIMVKDDVAKWFHSNGYTEVISDIVITKAE